MFKNHSFVMHFWGVLSSQVIRWSHSSIFKQLSGIFLLNIFASALGSGGTLLLAREVGVGEFGLLSMIMTIGGTLSLLILLGSNYAMYHFLPKSGPENIQRYISAVLYITLVLSIILLGLNALFGQILSQRIGLSKNLWNLSVFFALTMAFNGITEAILRGRERLWLVSVLRTGVSLFCLSLFIAGLFAFGFEQAVHFAKILMLGHILFSLVSLWTTWPISLRVEWKIIKTIYQYGAIMTLTSVLMAVMFSLDIIFINYYHGSESVGFFSAYVGFVKRIFFMLFNEGVAIFLFPILVASHRTNSIQIIKKYMPLGMILITTIIFIMTWILFLIIQKNFGINYTFILLSSIGIALHSVFNLFFSVFAMDGKQGAKLAVKNLLLAMPLAIGIQWYLIKHYDVIGGILAFIATNFILVVVFWLSSNRRFMKSDSVAQTFETAISDA